MAITHLIEKQKIRIVFPPIEKKQFNTKKAPSYDAVWMARIHPSKGVSDLLRIWKQVVKTHPKRTLAIIGTGERQYIDELEKSISDEKLNDSVNYLGYQSDEKAFGMIAASSLFLHTSHEEGFGLTIGEVLLCGTPVLSYDLPVFREVYSPVLRVSPQGNIDIFAKRVISMLQNPLKEKKRVADNIPQELQHTCEKARKEEEQIIYEATHV